MSRTFSAVTHHDSSQSLNSQFSVFYFSQQSFFYFSVLKTILADCRVEWKNNSNAEDENSGLGCEDERL